LRVGGVGGWGGGEVPANESENTAWVLAVRPTSWHPLSHHSRITHALLTHYHALPAVNVFLFILQLMGRDEDY